MVRKQKEYVTAYALWLLVGVFAGHRIYLARGASAMLFVVAHLGGWAFLFYAYLSDSEQYIWPALLLLAAVYAWLVVDLIFIPSMADAFNDKLDQDKGPYMDGPLSLDPGFQATLRKAGMATEGQRKASIPDDYVMPWRRQDGGGPTASGDG